MTVAVETTSSIEDIIKPLDRIIALESELNTGPISLQLKESYNELVEYLKGSKLELKLISHTIKNRFGREKGHKLEASFPLFDSHPEQAKYSFRLAGILTILANAAIKDIGTKLTYNENRGYIILDNNKENGFYGHTLYLNKNLEVELIESGSRTVSTVYSKHHEDYIKKVLKFIKDGLKTHHDIELTPMVSREKCPTKSYPDIGWFLANLREQFTRLPTRSSNPVYK